MKFKNANWTRFNKYLYKYWKLQATVIILGLITIPLSLLNPYLTKLVIDKAYGNKDLKLFLILAIIGGGIFVFNGFISSLNGYLSQHIKRGVQFDMTKDLFKQFQSLPLSFLNDKSTGEHIYMISGDVGLVSNFICNVIPQIIELFPRFLFILVVVFYLNWKLALFALLLIPLNYIPSFFLAKWLRMITLRMIEKSQDIFKRLNESFSHIKLVKALGREDYETKRLEENFTKKIDLELKSERLSTISNFSTSILNQVIIGLIALYGGYQVIKGTMTLGSLTAVMIYVTQFFGLTGSIVRFYENIIVNSVSCQRLAQVFDIKPEIKDTEKAIDYRLLQGGIEFRDASFGYKKDNFVLKNISFSIGVGSHIALVGSSGCGKTTLLNLILRLYELRQGSILIDGVDIRDMKLEFLKAQIGIALQESFLWNDTLKNNILYAKESATMDEVMRAARIAEIDSFITSLPQGYETQVGESACKISEGQKQRIAIARAVIKNPKILILDEAMSSLDSQIEDKIIDNIKHEFRDSTLIVVSHRLSTAKKMDLIYFLENFNKMNIGMHDEFIKRNPKYRELFASQIEQKEGILNKEFKEADMI